jgi:hypothetical protein
MKKIFIILIVFFLSGCSIGFVNESSTLMEKPFAVVTMQGDITEATRCVGRYWQKSINEELSAWWNVTVDSYQVKVTGPGGGNPPVGLVINFDTVDGKTIASAHLHRMFFSQKDPRRTVTLRALDACRSK